ncbi:SDR family oxidoreductase [Candidatus Pelagibacter ubique]|jgi:NAD(P)-dependent dehydrogenase (short-subunit alcohol dehydrogenase family)|nr:SDR family oxidoreductase [Candidatus Pelagibacter ubique]MDC3407477.1 SDR family oxidoreductase [Candidatus Pelagibacter ubique]
MSEKILIIGKNSIIAKEFIKKINNTQIIAPPKSLWNMNNTDFSKKQINIIKNVDKILLLQSVISSKFFLDRKQSEITKQININLLSVIKICELALNYNKKVKIIVLGSESGIKGSYDIVYGLMKSSIHKYVEERKIKYSSQQLLCISPSTIIDTKMTLSRKDQKNVLKSILKNPKKRGIKSKEIADLIYSIFYDITDYMTNTVIRVDGGKFSRM